MKRYEPTVHWDEPENRGSVRVTTRLQESPAGSVVKWEDHCTSRQDDRDTMRNLVTDRNAIHAELRTAKDDARRMQSTIDELVKEPSRLDDELRGVTAERDVLRKERDELREQLAHWTHNHGLEGQGWRRTNKEL
ncbi:MAG TPA: hypothetical protein VJ553_05900, partial [Candidatus Paceibacterota bacterium]|nr:hypothetical protein [Candidatus Paceibacterota bacterium]